MNRILQYTSFSDEEGQQDVAVTSPAPSASADDDLLDAYSRAVTGSARRASPAVVNIEVPGAASLRLAATKGSK